MYQNFFDGILLLVSHDKVKSKGFKFFNLLKKMHIFSIYREFLKIIILTLNYNMKFFYSLICSIYSYFLHSANIFLKNKK